MIYSSSSSSGQYMVARNIGLFEVDGRSHHRDAAVDEQTGHAVRHHLEH